ncbi:hypothetical protein ATANTOWER_027383 [Ataeniobius toweri]|uniref:Uncharacterized protein n=1 Tax=Ataeniobius toweri TaxID=208326 RepID=A0ABU7CGC4_9TELE|nr:hypothetical protein [Ataeniobius toweri]
MVVLDNTAHLQRSGGVIVDKSGLFWQQELDKQTIRQVVIMLCLMSVSPYLLPSFLTSITPKVIHKQLNSRRIWISLGFFKTASSAQDPHGGLVSMSADI